MELEHTLPTQKTIDTYVAQAKHLRNQTLIELVKRGFHLPKHRVRHPSVLSQCEK